MKKHNIISSSSINNTSSADANSLSNASLHAVEFSTVRHFRELVEPNIYSGIYIWGFKFSGSDLFVPYYVGIADKCSIYKRLVHHYTKLDTTYKLFDVADLKDFFKYLDNASNPKVKGTKLIYENSKPKNLEHRKLSKEDPLCSASISFYRENFYYTYAPVPSDGNQKSILEFLETYVKYSLPNQTVSKSHSINGKSFKWKKQMYDWPTLSCQSNDLWFKESPSPF